MNDCLLSLVQFKSLASCIAFPCPALSALCFCSSIRGSLRSRVPLFISNELFALQGSCVATIALNCCNYILLAPSESLYETMQQSAHNFHSVHHQSAITINLNQCNIISINQGNIYECCNAHKAKKATTQTKDYHVTERTHVPRRPCYNHSIS